MCKKKPFPLHCKLLDNAFAVKRRLVPCICHTGCNLVELEQGSIIHFSNPVDLINAVKKAFTLDYPVVIGGNRVYSGAKNITYCLHRYFKRRDFFKN